MLFDPGRFRSRIDMHRHAFGEGEYQYFAYPLPEIVAELRQATYPRLAPTANRWSEHLGLGQSISQRISMATSNSVTEPAKPGRRRSC